MNESSSSLQLSHSKTYANKHFKRFGKRKGCVNREDLLESTREKRGNQWLTTSVQRLCFANLLIGYVAISYGSFQSWDLRLCVTSGKLSVCCGKHRVLESSLVAVLGSLHASAARGFASLFFLAGGLAVLYADMRHD
jgi:hypothetical protein